MYFTEPEWNERVRNAHFERCIQIVKISIILSIAL